MEPTRRMGLMATGMVGAEMAEMPARAAMVVEAAMAVRSVA